MYNSDGVIFIVSLYFIAKRLIAFNSFECLLAQLYFLMESTLNKIVYTKYSIIKYIRSYAHKLSMIKQNILLNVNFSKEFIYKVNKDKN